MRLDYSSISTYSHFKKTPTFKPALSPRFLGSGSLNEFQAKTSPAFYPAKPIPGVITLFNQLFSGLICRPLDFKVQCHNPENLAALKKQELGLILTMNHSSLMDKATLLKLNAQTSLMPITMASFTAATAHLPSLLIWPIVSRFGIFSVNEGNASVAKTKRFAQNTLQNGKYPLCIFPEGRINWHNAKPGPCQRGTMQIALNAAQESQKNMKVVPIGITYQYSSKAEQRIWKTIKTLEKHIEGSIKTNPKMPEFKKPPKNATLQEHLVHLLEWAIRRSESDNRLMPASQLQTHRVEQLRHQIILGLKSEYGATLSNPDRAVFDLYKAIHLRQHENKKPPFWVMLNPWSRQKKEYRQKLSKAQKDIQKLNTLELLTHGVDALNLKPNLSNQMEAVCRLRCLILNKSPSMWDLMRHCTAHVIVDEPILVTPMPAASTAQWDNKIFQLTQTLQTGLENAVSQARQYNP